jgi:hypothetical protein
MEIGEIGKERLRENNNILLRKLCSLHIGNICLILKPGASKPWYGMQDGGLDTIPIQDVDVPVHYLYAANCPP